MREKRNEIINSSIEWSKMLSYLAWGCSSFWLHSGERYKAFMHAKFCLLLVLGTINCLFFADPTVVPASEINLPDPRLPIKVTDEDALSATNQAGSSRPVSAKTNPNKTVLERRNSDPEKSANAPRKVSGNPYSAKTLLAAHPPPLLEPTSDSATSLSGPNKPESVNLFKRLIYRGERMDRYQGKGFIAEGEAYHSKGIPKGYFMLFRWHIDCCTGEVEPVGILVRSNFIESPNKSSWVKVDGILEIQMIGDFRVPYIAAVQVEKIPAPPPEKQFISF